MTAAPVTVTPPDPVRGGPPRRPARRRLMGTWAPVGFTVLWALYSALNFLLSGRWWPWLLPDLAPPVFFLAVPLALLALSWTPATGRTRRWLIPVLVLLLVSGLTRTGLNWGAVVPGGGAGPAPAGALKVFSWNTQYWDTEDDSAAFYRFLKAKDADVYLLQEYLGWVDEQPAMIDELARLRAEVPGYHAVVKGELVTLSRFPVIASPPVGRSGAGQAGLSWREVFERDKVLRTDLDIRGRRVSFYNVHIPVQLDIARDWLSGGFYREVRKRDAARREQYEWLERDVAANPGPVLVAGDFNTTPAMGDLEALRDTLDDALPASGAIHPGTWGLGLWRLDWAFTDDGLRVHRYAFEDPAGLADHRAQNLVVSLVR